MSTCPTCGTQYARNVRLCPRDGTVLAAEPAQDTRVGQVLDAKYRLDSRLSSGGMGTVYKATHLMLGKTVAVKLINPELVTSPEIVRRFQREARAAGNLNHPNIAAAYDLGQTQDGTLYIAMEFVNGPSLKDVIRRTGPIEQQRIVAILGQVASALSLAHRHNIIHRDLKPHNIMLATDEAGREVAKLLDFGIAKTFDEAATQQLTTTGFAIGTPQYMAPEQAAGKPVDARSDLYSLGVVLYEMLVGEVPFNDPSTPAVLVKHMTEVPAQPSRRRPDLHIAPAVEAVALKCLEKDPAARIQTADEFARALTQAASADSTPSAAATTVLVPPGATSAPTVPASPSAATLILPDAKTPAAAANAASHTATTQLDEAGQQTTKADLRPVTPPTPVRPASIDPPAASVSRGSDLPTSDLPIMRRTDPVQPAAAASSPSSPAPLPQAAAPLAATPAAPPVPGTIAASPASSNVPLAARAATGTLATESARSSRGSLAAGLVLLLLLVGGVGFAAYRMGYWSGPRQAAPAAEQHPIEAPVSSPSQPPPIQPLDAVANSSKSDKAAPASVSGGAGKRAATDLAVGRPTPSAGSAPDRTSARSTAAGPPTPSAYGAPTAAPQATLPDNPPIFFRCSGPAEVCTAIRAAVSEALDQASLPAVRDPQRAEIMVEATVTPVDERESQQYGTAFIVRTYSIELSGEALRSGQSVPMPAPVTLSYDARVGQERVNERARLTADAVVERVKAYWKKRQ
jgi:serine/threonine protein kinase